MAWRALDYQERALGALDAYLERLAEERAKGAKLEAFIAENPDAGATWPDYPSRAWERLAREVGVPDGRAYSPRASGDGRPVPNATLKVPTGGGKTFLACAALSRIFGRLLGSNTGMVLWIVPNEAIYAQTLRALRDRDHAYRQTLDRAAAGRVKVLEKGDPLHRGDLGAHLCVMLLMLQSSNRQNQEALRLFRDRGDVHGFVPPDGAQGAHAALLAAVPNLDAYDMGDGMAPWPMVKASMGNAMRIVRPVVVMDEGQRAVSDLAFSTLYGFNPSFVLELTATPRDVTAKGGRPARPANILCAITGRELEREGMIKMPMNVIPQPSAEWQATLGEAWRKLEELEQAAGAYAGDGGRYIRPILLVQVERTGAEQAGAGFIHSNDAAGWLKAVAGLEDDQIAFKTAERNDLDLPENRDLLSPKCRVRAIITKAALAEGWDCPFAYVLCALAANGNEGAMTQLVGRVLRQPWATRTGMAALDECYVYAHRAGTAETVAAIKRGLEGDGLGDLAADVTLGGSGGDGAASRRIARRDAFRLTDVALPQVLTIEEDGRARALDAETDLYPLVDWTAFDLKALALGIPKDAQPPDAQMVRLRAGERGVETEGAVSLPAPSRFDAAYAVRMIGDLVPNAFAAWSLVDGLMTELRGLSWDDALLGRLAGLMTDELRKGLAAERDRQAANLFAKGLGSGRIRFALWGNDKDWHAPSELSSTQTEDAAQLFASTGGPLERSLFAPIYAAELNPDETHVARRLDRDAAVRWWHRNGVTRGSYGLRGWRRGAVYPDFLFTVVRKAGARDRIVVLETKGEQLAGNHDTLYKEALLEVLSDAAQTGGTSGLAADHGSLAFGAAVMPFDQVDAHLPFLMLGKGSPAEA